MSNKCWLIFTKLRNFKNCYSIYFLQKGLGIRFLKNSENIYSAESHSLHPIYILLKNSEEQILLEPGILILNLIFTVLSSAAELFTFDEFSIQS